MISRNVMSLAFATGFVLAMGTIGTAQAQALPPQAQPYPGPTQVQVASNQPQASAGDFGDWSAERNNIESAQYDHLLQVSPGFRHMRMRQECGPISDPQLHEQCRASFDQYEPARYGADMPRWRHHRQEG